MGEVGKFAFFRSFRDALEGFNDASRLMFYEALMAYAFDGTEPDFGDERALTMAWRLAKPNVDSSIRGQVNGAKGGRGRKGRAALETPSETPRKAMGETLVDSSGDAFDDRSEGGLKPPVPTDMDREADGDGRANAPNIRPPHPPWQQRARSDPKPFCPLCDEPLWRNTQTGRLTCSSCQDAYDDGRATWR